MATAENLITAKWRDSILEWSRSWPESGYIMPSGRRRSAFRLLRACMALAGRALADGRLKGSRDYWSTEQLAGAMGMTRKSAADTLAWLEQNGRLVKSAGILTTEGRGADRRRLILPSGSQVNSTEPNGPVGNAAEASGSQTPSLWVTDAKPVGNDEIDRDPTPLNPLSSLIPLEINRERARRLREQVAELARRKAM